MPQGATQPISDTIDVAFRLQGDTLPVDHGYALYGALSRLPVAGPWLHQSEDAAIQCIRGHYIGQGQIKLDERSRLRLRLSAAALPTVLPLAGKVIEIDGHRLRIGIPQTTLLDPAPILYAHLVTTRNGQDEQRFDAEVRHQLDAISAQATATRGKRRVFRIKDKTVVAHSLLISGLTADESIRLQQQGLGGRRKMGCGVFYRWRG